jgi:hypothetical protein
VRQGAEGLSVSLTLSAVSANVVIPIPMLTICWDIDRLFSADCGLVTWAEVEVLVSVLSVAVGTILVIPIPVVITRAVDAEAAC